MPSTRNFRKRIRTLRAKKPSSETKRNLGWDEDKTFYVPEEVYEHFGEAAKRGAEVEEEWNDLVEAYMPKNTQKTAKHLKMIMRNELPEDWEDALPKFENVESKATRAYSGEVINAIAEKLPQL